MFWVPTQAKKPKTHTHKHTLWNKKKMSSAYQQQQHCSSLFQSSTLDGMISTKKNMGRTFEPLFLYRCHVFLLFVVGIYVCICIYNCISVLVVGICITKRTKRMNLSRWYWISIAKHPKLTQTINFSVIFILCGGVGGDILNRCHQI